MSSVFISSFDPKFWESVQFFRLRLGFAAAGDSLTCLTVSRFAALGFAFVPALFSSGQCNLTFYFAVAEIESCWDERKTALLGFPNQLSQLFLVQEQLSSTHRVVIEDVSMFIGTDMRVEEPGFAVFDDPVGVFEVRSPAADRLHLGTAQRDSSLVLL